MILVGEGGEGEDPDGEQLGTEENEEGIQGHGARDGAGAAEES